MSNNSFQNEYVIGAFNSRFTQKDWDALLQSIGWTLCADGKYTRPDKAKGVSGQLINASDVLLFHSFTSNSNLPNKKSGKQTYSPAEIICHYGYNGDWSSACKYFRSQLGTDITFAPMPERKPTEPLHFDFSDVSKDFLYNDSGERLYRFSLNKTILNKNFNPILNSPYENYSALTNNFKNVALTAQELAGFIGAGNAICPATLKNDFKRKQDNWDFAELLIIDIDGTMTIQDCMRIEKTQTALLIYTTPSHSFEKHRFRIIFHLPYIEKNSERYKALIKSYADIYKADKQATSIVNSFYGNSNAEMYLIQENKQIQYINGVPLFRLPRDKPLFEVHKFDDTIRYVSKESKEEIYASYRRQGIELKLVKEIYIDPISNKIIDLNGNIDDTTRDKGERA